MNFILVCIRYMLAVAIFVKRDKYEGIFNGLCECVLYLYHGVSKRSGHILLQRGLQHTETLLLLLPLVGAKPLPLRFFTFHAHFIFCQVSGKRL